MPDSDLARIVAESRLRYPVATRSEFVEQMSRSPQVSFRGVSYDTRHAAALMPGFFFPIESADDLIQKATELLASRGLTAPNDAPDKSIEEVLAEVEAAITADSTGGTDRARIEALDVVTHALEFVGHPRALALWRAAGAGRFLPDTRTAVATMLEHIQEAIDRGDWRAVAGICDCLVDIYSPNVPRT